MQRRSIGALGRIALVVASVAVCVIAAAGCRASHSSDEPAALDVAAATKETEEWRAAHEESYRRNWATIAGLHFLEPGSHTAGSARTNDIVLPASAPSVIGRFVLEGDVVRFAPEPGSRVLLANQPVTHSITLADDFAAEPDRLEVGSIRMVVHRSGERKSLRVWDPEGELARGFLGFRWFEIEMDYRVTGRFIRDPAPRDVQVLNTFGDRDTFTTEGVVEFTLQGQTLRLRPFTTRPKRLVLRVSRSVKRRRDLRSGALPLRRSSRRWHRGARFQPGLQSALCIQPLYDVSDSASGEPARGEGPRGGARVSRSPDVAQVLTGHHSLSME